MKNSSLNILISLLFLFPFSSLYAQEIGKNIQVKWELIDNHYQDQKKSLTRVSIFNNSDLPIPVEGWNLWFSNMRSIDVNSIEDSFKLEHINGDLYKLSPSIGFSGLQAKDSLSFTMVVKSRIPNFTDAPSGLYITSDVMEPSIQPVPNVEIVPFSYPTPHNKEVLAKLYEKNEKIKTANKVLPPGIVPSPKSLIATGKFFTLTNEVRVSGNPDFSNEIELLKKEFSSLVKQEKGIISRSPNTIVFEKLPSLVPEGYELVINEKKILVKASTNAGAFYAVQSLLSLLPIQNINGPQSPIQLPTLSISDEPRLAHRAFMMDLARNFQDKKQILKVLDLMASYKLNVFHMHLNDDEGWRIEIPSLPELTEVGSKRSAYFKKGITLQPSYGSGAFAKPDQFLTRADFIDILRYAKERHIQVIPEIETPGHARAAIKSMDFRANLGIGNRITDPNDQSKYRSAQYWTDNIMDVGLPSTFKFMETVIDELINMYKDAGLQLKTVHMGGDEVPRGSWEGSPAIQQLMKEKNIPSVHRVWTYYVEKILEIAEERGLAIAGWEELGMVNEGKGMVPNPQFGTRNLQLDVWNNIVGGGNEDLAYRLANVGYPVVFTSANNFYFDLAWNDNFNEPGHNWAGYIDLEKAYGFMVHNFLRNLPEAIAAKKQPLTAEGKKNVIGIQGALWSEKIISPERLEYMLIPRIFALAERAWAQEPEWEKPSQTNWVPLYQQDWSNFANRIGLKEIPRLENRWPGINYRLPSIGIKEIDGKVACNLELPGFYIVYTTDGSEPQVNGKRYTQAIHEKGVLKFKVFNSSGKGSYTTVYLHN